MNNGFKSVERDSLSAHFDESHAERSIESQQHKKIDGRVEQIEEAEGDSEVSRPRCRRQNRRINQIQDEPRES